MSNKQQNIFYGLVMLIQALTIILTLGNIVPLWTNMYWIWAVKNPRLCVPFQDFKTVFFN